MKRLNDIEITTKRTTLQQDTYREDLSREIDRELHLLRSQRLAQCIFHATTNACRYYCRKLNQNPPDAHKNSPFKYPK